MTPGLALTFMFIWAVMGCLMLWEGRVDPLHQRRFWLGVIGIIFAILYAVRWKKLKAAEADQ